MFENAREADRDTGRVLRIRRLQFSPRGYEGDATDTPRNRAARARLDRPGLALAERDPEELQRSVAKRAALVGCLRHAGAGEATDRPAAAPLQPPADPADAGQYDARSIRLAMLGAASAPARCARLRCGTAGHGEDDYDAPIFMRGGPTTATQSPLLSPERRSRIRGPEGH